MKKLLIAFGCVLALSACAETYTYSSSVVASPREARFCRAQGFTPGTYDFDNCVLDYRAHARERASRTPAS